jgi:hypothetical protein
VLRSTLLHANKTAKMIHYSLYMSVDCLLFNIKCVVYNCRFSWDIAIQWRPSSVGRLCLLHFNLLRTHLGTCNDTWQYWCANCISFNVKWIIFQWYSIMYHRIIITLLPFVIEMLQYDWLWSGHMIIKDMFYIPIKLKLELARAFNPKSGLSSNTMQDNKH